MPDDLDSRLRAGREHLPAPDPAETAAARERVVGSLVRPRPRRSRRRGLVLALALLASVAAAFGVGYAVAAAREPSAAPPPPRPTLNAGPGFLPAAGWDVATSGTAVPPQAQSAVAANVPLRPADRALQGPPRETAASLGPNGILLYATFAPVSTGGGRAWPQRLLPLQLDDARRVARLDGLPAVEQARRLRARVGLYDVEALVLFGAAQPSAPVLAAAREELGRLVVPACPDAQPVAAADLPAAKAYLLRWLRGHYPDDPSQLEGARASAAIGPDAPRGGAAVDACGAVVGARTVEVDVVLPKLEPISASLSQLSYFVARTPDGWTVWQRIH